MKQLILSLIICLTLQSALCSGLSPTEQYLTQYSLEWIKPHYRVEQVTFAYKDLYDKAVSSESEAFVGYHGSSAEFRIFQDLLNQIFTEILAIPIPEGFYFLDIPCFGERKIKQLSDIPHYFTSDRDGAAPYQEELFPLNHVLYANFNQLGLSSVVQFARNESQNPAGTYEAKMAEFARFLGISPQIIEEAFAEGYERLKQDRGILIQLFDESATPYAFFKNHAYPAYPNGYPFANRSLEELPESSDFLFHLPEIKLILNDSSTLNPNSPLRMKRWDKIQLSVIRSYENALRDLMQGAEYNETAVTEYKTKLHNAWNTKEMTCYPD